MHRLELTKIIKHTMSLFYYLGMWHRGDEATTREAFLKVFFTFYYFLLPISLSRGALIIDDNDESIFLAQLGIMTSVLVVKIYFIIWKQKEILQMLNGCAVFTVENDEDFNIVDKTLKIVEKFFFFLFFFTSIAAIFASIWPFLGIGDKLILNIVPDLDLKNNRIAFWVVNSFLFTEVCFALLIFCFSPIVWFSLINCALRYKVLGNEIIRMGEKKAERQVTQISQKEQQNIFFRDLIAIVDSHQHLRKLTDDLGSFLSSLLLVQVLTSAASICGSIYCLAFSVGNSYIQYPYNVVCLLYNISEIFMVTYLGNEIYLFTDRLSYCVFESNWIDQPQSTIKLVITFAELLKIPQELVIGKMYPLTLETFTRILNSAYSMFNILQKFK